VTTPADRLSNALLGRYRIERELGAGGMATVYLAEDLKHDRKVAIKVLKPELAAVLGAERFVVEIKTTAAMSHPHILPLFDSGTADGFLFYVMPYIQGETIREKLNRETQFGVDESVRIAREVADALDYAHRQGVIHRDIKPENILLHDGRAMVMDFGIALAVSAAAGGRMTETGLSLGTPHYMSPEQATAEKEITARSDQYSLASVLYEMLAGDPPFVASAAQAVIMKIITEPAQSVTTRRKNVPANVDAALARALEKLPADRFESAKAFADALQNAAYTSARDGQATASSRRNRMAASLAWSVAAVAIVAAVAGWMRRTPEQPLRRFDLSLGVLTKANNTDVVISPDGSMLAMTAIVGGEPAIYVRRLGEDPEFRRLAGTESGVGPEFSPDNQWIVFTKTSDGSLVKVLATGGGAVTLVPRGKVQPTQAHWGANGQIVFTGSTGTGTFRIAAAGGEPVPIPKVAGRRPFLLPDGSGVLHATAGQIELYDFKRDTSVVLIPGGRHATYVPTGHILYATTDNGLFAVAFDLAQHRVVGAPVRVLERVGTHTDARGYSVSATGVLVQFDAPGAGNLGTNRLLIVDPGRGADTVRLPLARRLLPRFSRDGRSLAMEVFADGTARTDIYTLDMVTGTYTQLTSDGDNDQPAWSPDGKRIVFDKAIPGQGGEDLFVRSTDNSAPERRVMTGAFAGDIEAAQWLDDKSLIFSAVVPGRAEDIFTVSTDSGSVPVPYLQSPFREREPALSPDRKLLAFSSNESSTFLQVWMREFPVPQGKWNISRGSGVAPRWSADGRYVYFWRGTPHPLADTLFRVRVDRTPGVVIHAPEIVFAINADGPTNWDLHPDGRRFILLVVAAEPAAVPGAGQVRYLIHQNWFGELRRLTGEKTRASP
jgi:serine/threonine protein kinase/Tol biopolymer transport system component